MNRALRATTMGALLLSPIALGACSAGQVTQTATQDRDKAGPMADVANITLRSVLLEYPTGARYDEGDDAELTAAIVNIADESDTLLSIESDAFEEVRVLGDDVEGVSQSSGATGGDIGLEIPRNGSVYLGDDGPTVLLENLAQDLTPGQGIELTMTFELAGEVTVRAQVATPDEALERGEAFDFHHEEEAGSDEREAASGAGSEDTGDGHGG